ncbi:type-F conjugative transfer system secretin TraK [Marinobacter alkaliphilus]|uniref:Type-F conjugative transfer system secretin TraK n=1 Tax=Marinobacter alkaliphilus TaxID=254719 RepID=A0ABZ3EAR7_9GAMM
MSEQNTRESYIVVEPGVNEILQISRGHPNRILLPFENPKIQTTAADAQIKADGSVVFVATNSQRPVTLFVSPHDNPRLALSLTLVPGSIPPSQYEIRLSEDGSTVPAGGYFMGNSAAERWEKKGNYTRALVNLFEELAKENLPQGYKLRNPSPGHDLHTCYSGDQVDYKMAQVVEGHHLVVQILVAQNTGAGPVEVIGSHCAAEGVVAAAEWPNSVLEPGQKTEMFVAFERQPVAKQNTRRPSAIGGR